MTLELHGTPEEVMRAVRALQSFAQTQGLPEKAIFDLALGLEECASNIVNHAYQRDATKTFQVAFEIANGAFVIELRDTGPAFDPTSVPRKSQADDDDLPGGLGIELVRRHVDDIHYERTHGRNILRLTKQLKLKIDGR